MRCWLNVICEVSIKKCTFFKSQNFAAILYIKFHLIYRMKFSFKANSLFRVRVKTSEDFKSVTEGVMVSYDRNKDEIAVKRYIRDSSWVQGSDEAVLVGYLESLRRCPALTNLKTSNGTGQANQPPSTS